MFFILNCTIVVFVLVFASYQVYDKIRIRRMIKELKSQEVGFTTTRKCKSNCGKCSCSKKE